MLLLSKPLLYEIILQSVSSRGREIVTIASMATPKELIKRLQGFLYIGPIILTGEHCGPTEKFPGISVRHTSPYR